MPGRPMSHACWSAVLAKVGGHVVGCATGAHAKCRAVHVEAVDGDRVDAAECGHVLRCGCERDGGPGCSGTLAAQAVLGSKVVIEVVGGLQEAIGKLERAVGEGAGLVEGHGGAHLRPAVHTQA